MATKYNKAWEDSAKYPEFASWIQRGHLDSQFRCMLCGEKDLNIDNMGQRALVSHLEGMKHAVIISTMRSSSRLSSSGESRNTQPDITIALPANTHVSEVFFPLERMILANHVTLAEIRWALKRVQPMQVSVAAKTLGSCLKIAKLLQHSVLDQTKIAISFALGWHHVTWIH